MHTIGLEASAQFWIALTGLTAVAGTLQAERTRRMTVKIIQGD